jgi:hypothetical protein
MFKYLLIIFVVAMGIFNHAVADEMPLGMLAIKIPEAAVAAVKLRNAGKPKNHLTDALPPKGAPMGRVGQELHRIADEVYGNDWVQGLPYYVYTLRRFELELEGKPTPKNFGQVSQAVKECQANESDDNRRISCVTAALNEFSKSQQ